MESDIQDTFIRFYDAESDSIFRFCLLRTSDREVALDITQDTFMSFWDTLMRGERDIRNGRAFLFAVARNRIIDWYRKKKSLSLESLTEDSGIDIEAFMSEPQARRADIEMEHEAKYLMEKLRKIDPAFQQVIYLRYVEGLMPREIAEVVGQSVNVVSVRIFRGLQQLKKVAGYDEKKHE